MATKLGNGGLALEILAATENKEAVCQSHAFTTNAVILAHELFYLNYLARPSLWKLVHSSPGGQSSFPASLR